MPTSALRERIDDSSVITKALLSRVHLDSTIPPDDDHLRLPGAPSGGNIVPLPLRALRQGPQAGASVREAANAEAQDRGSGLRTLVAADLAQRERAFRLAYRVYLDCGYVVETEARRIVSKFDAQPSTLVLLVQDAAGSDAATVSLVFDSPAGLPSDEVHGTELASLRAQGRRLVEVTRLAIDLPYVGSKYLLVELFNAITAYARHVQGSTDCVIEVNPRHVNYYRRLLMFEPGGPERPCPRANGASAMLLRLDLAAQASEIAVVGGSHGQARGPHGRTLYSHFCAPDQESQLAAIMHSQQRPMSVEERRYFRLDRTGIPSRPARIAADTEEAIAA
jgi:hypothetical protein